MSFSFVLKYDGLDADDHTLDVRRFGEAMVGLDTVVNSGLVALAEYRQPKKGERLALRIRAKEPAQGSFEILAELSPVAMATVLPLVPEIINSAAAEIIWRWLSWVLSMAGGRQNEADPHFAALMDLTKEIHKGRAESEEANRKFLLEVLNHVLPSARGIVAPVGPSADTLMIAPDRATEPREHTTIDVPMADAIRAGEKLTVGDMETMRVRVDGLIHHSKQIKIENPDDPGKFVTAQVRDPAFLESENVYTAAVGVKGYLEVSAKPSRKADGSLHALYILDARSIDAKDA